MVLKGASRWQPDFTLATAGVWADCCPQSSLCKDVGRSPFPSSRRRQGRLPRRLLFPDSAGTQGQIGWHPPGGDGHRDAAGGRNRPCGAGRLSDQALRSPSRRRGHSPPSDTGAGRSATSVRTRLAHALAGLETSSVRGRLGFRCGPCSPLVDRRGRPFPRAESGIALPRSWNGRHDWWRGSFRS